MSAPGQPSPALASLRRNGWVWGAALLVVLKLSLLRAQPIYAIGNAIHDEELFLRLARAIADGRWLGAYDHLTLAKGPVYSAFIAANYYLGLPLRLAEQLVYVGACALVVRALAPVLAAGWARLLVFATLLWNPLTYEGEHMTRVLRQHLTTPFALIVAGALLALALRRDRPFAARLPWALTAGLAFGLFWITREEGIWIVGMTGLLAAAAFAPVVTGPRGRRGAALGLLLATVLAAAAPLLTVATLNLRHYGWFGPTEFHARDFRDAYGALVRIQAGPSLPYVAVSREAREAAYAVSPAFAELRPHLEGEIGDRWSNKEDFRPEERQIGSGWFMWALRDAVAAAGHTGSAAEALAFYRRIADEVNRACDEGRLPARPPRSGFFPPWHSAYTQALRTEGPVYLRGAFDFRAFEPNPPYSVGTDDEVRIFRDLTHERISPSLRATHIELPAQRALDARKLGALRTLGRTLGPVLTWFILAAHAVALVRLVQLVRARRLTVPFLGAVAAWGGGAAELALNILVHTTSFPNFYPAAYAPAMPLLLLFALLVAVDALPAWRAPAAALRVRVQGWFARHPHGTVAAGVGLLVFAARLHEIARHGGDVPFLDQWKIEGQQVLAPWLDGTFAWASLFAPHHEHIPVWTRLLAWLQGAALGTWDPQLQMGLNAAFHATWAALLAGWLRRHLPAAAGWIAALLVVALAGLPHAWENITWGFQSQFPLALLALFVLVRGSLAEISGSRGWWLAQGAGLAGLFTLGSFWTAPLLLAAVNLLAAPRERRAWLAPLGLALAGALLMFLAIRSQPAEGALALHGRGLRDVLQAWFHQAGWPVAGPGGVVLVNLPLAWLALRLRRGGDTAFDRTVIVLGLWSIGQAAGLAYARGADGADFVSRYSDLFAVGVIANAAAALRLLAGARGWRPLAWLAFAGWLGAIGIGLHRVNTVGHAAYFHEHSGGRAALRREAVQAYLATRDAAVLARPEVRALLYPDPAAVAALLDRPDFAALLPASARQPGATARGAGGAVADRWAWFAAAGLFLLGGGVFAGRPARMTAIAPLPGLDRTAAWWLGGLAAAATAALFLWPRPWDWNQQARWERLVYPAPGVIEPGFSFASATDYPADRVIGAAALAPESLRNLFYGSHVDGPGFSGVIASEAFPVAHDWLVVPVAGFPASAGNALALEIEQPDGTPAVRLAYTGANPRDVGFWALDLRAYRGRSARLVLTDGRTGDEGWLAVAPPYPVDNAAAATSRDAAWAAERSNAARRTLILLALVAGAAAGIVALRTRHRH